jgi:hypothetical protein
MSIVDYSKALLLSGVEGAERLVMNYEGGGKVEVYSIDDRAVRVRAGARIDEIEQAFKALP